MIARVEETASFIESKKTEVKDQITIFSKVSFGKGFTSEARTVMETVERFYKNFSNLKITPRVLVIEQDPDETMCYRIDSGANTGYAGYVATQNKFVVFAREKTGCSFGIKKIKVTPSQC